MPYYIVIRNRCFIDLEYIRKNLGTATRSTEEWSWVYGPYYNIIDANRAYGEVLVHVDDDDYGIFTVDKSGQWWRIPNGNLTCKMKLEY